MGSGNVYQPICQLYPSKVNMKNKDDFVAIFINA